jgi:hypothetical protein
MPFSQRHLSVLAYSQGFTLWHYRTAQPLGEILSQADFFSPAQDMIRAGDQLHLSAPDGAALVAFPTHERFVTMSHVVWGKSE